MLHAGWTAAFESDPRGMKGSWLAFLGGDRRFPRELMVPSTYQQGGRKRWEVPNAIALVEELTQRAPRADVWIATRPSHAYYEETTYHSHLWFDVDAKGDLELARLRAEAVSLWCEEVLGVTPYAQFSASKGFHLHLDHGSVLASPEQYRAGVLNLLEEAGLEADDVDGAVLGNPRMMPRPPYTANTNAIPLHGELLFTVPVSLEWSVEEVLRASREVRLGEVRIPRSRDGGRVLEEAALDVPPEAARKSLDSAGARRLCDEAAGFLEQVAPYVRDGRKRLLRHLAIPAYLNLEPSVADARERCRAWVERSGAEWNVYRPYVEGQLKASRLEDGRSLYPMRVRRFIVKHPEILRNIRSD